MSHSRRVRSALISALVAGTVGTLGVVSMPSPAAAFDPPPLPAGITPTTLDRSTVEPPMCERIWCPPDYVASIESGKVTRKIDGRIAHLFVVTIENAGLSNPGPLNSSLRSQDARDRDGVLVDSIVDVEVVEGGPIEVTHHLDLVGGLRIVNLHHVDGIAPEVTVTVHVWVTENHLGRVELSAHPNHMRTTRGTSYRPALDSTWQREASPWNNRDHLVL